MLGTTALAAVGLLASNVASADEMMAEPISVGVGGYYTIAAIAYDEDDAMNDRGHGINQNMEMQIAGSSTLDNGITVGVRVRFSANDYEHSDEQEVTFSGGFGSLHVGAIEGAAQQTVIWAPGNSVPIGGIKSPWFGGIGGMWNTGAGPLGLMDEDALKVVYFSPSFNGISFAASYAPEDNTNSYGTDFDGGRSTDDDANEEQVAVALSYTVDVMGGSFSANVGYESYTSNLGATDPEGLRYGALISIDQIALGGAVYDKDVGGVTTSYSDIGVSWTDGPMMLGVQYGDNESNNSNIVAFNANYNLGPGIDLGLQIGAGESGANDFTQLLLGTMLNF